MRRLYPGIAVTQLVAALLFFGFCAGRGAVAQVAGEGTEFTLAFPYLSPSDRSETERIRLLVTGDPGTPVELRYGATGATRNFTLGPNGYSEYVIDTTDIALPWEEGLFDRSLDVRAPTPITLAVMLDRGTASEAFGAIPHRLLGTTYTTLSLRSFYQGSFVVVAATEDNTSVTITPRLQTKGGRPPSLPFTVVLDKGEIYQMLSLERTNSDINDDMSGSLVEADRPVAVWSGTTCASLPTASKVCGPVIEQLPSHEALGRTHFFARYPAEQGAFWKVMGTCGPTRLQTPDLLPVIDSLMPDRTGYSGEAFGDGRIESSAPVVAAHFGVNLDPRVTDLGMATADAVMSLLTPVEQMAGTHRFGVPTLASRGNDIEVPWIHTVSVVRSSPSVVVQLDGTPLVFNGLFASAIVGPGKHEVEGTGPVAVTVNGRSFTDAYAFVPAPVIRRGELRSDGIFNHICGDEFDTVVYIANTGSADVTVESVAFTNGLSGTLISPDLPFTVPANDSIQVRLRFTNLRSGSDSGMVVMSRKLCHDLTVLELPVDLKPDRLTFNPPSGGLLTFPPAFPVSPWVDATMTVTNPTSYPVTIASAAITPSSITLADPTILPLTIPPGASRQIVLRYVPAPGDREVSGRVDFFTANCPDTSLYGLDLEVLVRYLRVIEPPTLSLKCDPKEPDTLSIYLINYDAVPLQVKNAQLLTGGGDFTLLPTHTFPSPLAAVDSVRFDILYTPGPLGRHDAVLEMIVEGNGLDTLLGTVRVQNELTEFSLNVSALDFGRILCDTSGPRRLSIRNTGTLPLEGLRVEAVRGEEFRLQRSSDDAVLPGEELVVEVFPTAGPGREAFDTIRILEPTCGAELLIPVRSRCIARGNLRIGFSNESGEIGSVLPLPLYLQSEPGSFAAGAQVMLRMKLRFAADMLLPEELTEDASGDRSFRIVSSSVEVEERVVEIELSGRLGEDGVIAELPMLVLLGSDFVTRLEIEDFSFAFMNDVFEGEAEPTEGSFTALGWCAVGHPRLVDAAGEFGLKVLPNPARDEVRVRVDLVEDGETTLLLFDALGREVSRLPLNEAGAGSWLVRLPLDHLPAGAYNLLLTTPTQQLRVPLLIER